METIRIKIINKIAPEGLQLFGDRFSLNPDEPNPHGIVVRSSEVDTGDYPELLAVARAGAGVNNITVDKASEQGICVFNAPGANANAVAELFFTMLGVWARNIHHGMEFCQGLAGLDNETINREVEARKSAFRGVELAGKTLGVIGLGKIGTMVANGGLQRRMAVVGFDPSPSLDNIHLLSPEVTVARSMAEVVSAADVLTIHVPLGKKTKGLVNRAFLAQMKPGSMLVNYARGPIVDEPAVLAALESGGLDAFLTDFPSRSFLEHPKVLVSPHLGASTEESEENCARMAVKELRDYLRYGTISRSVNFPTAETIPSSTCHTRFIMINKDIPGMIGFASNIIGANAINIGSYLNESNGVVGYNIIDLESPLPEKVQAEIEANPNVIRTRIIQCQGQ